MDSKNGEGERTRRRSKTIRYFFANDDLHKHIHINRGTDLLTAWNYPKRQIVGLSWISVKRSRSRAYTMTEAAKLVNRNKLVLENAILNGDVEAPQMTYSLKPEQMGRNHKYMYSEANVLEMHAFLCTVHKGRPRKDGHVTPYNLPSLQELRSRMNQDVVLYVKNDRGDFVPTWQAHQF